MLIVILGGYVLTMVLNKYSIHHSICLFKTITTIPCPGCGMGRATVALLHGHPIEATIFHPLAIPFHLFLMISVVWIIIDLTKGQQSFYTFMTTDVKVPAKILIVFLLLVLWVYNIWRGI